MTATASEPPAARILGAHLGRPPRARGVSHGVPFVAVMVDRRLKSQKVDEIRLTAEEAVALAAGLLAAAVSIGKQQAEA